jgi:hypothetical protein
MKYIIKESKLNSAIYEYIDQLFHNGYNIRMEAAEDEDGSPIEYAYDFIQENGGFGFLFTWTGKEYYEKEGNENITSFGKRWIDYAPVVEISEDEIIDQLKGMFGELWVPIFKQWFTDTFSLPVKTVEY